MPGASGQSCGASDTHRRRDIGDRIARFVIDRDELGAVARDRLALGDDERDGLAGMADAVAGQRRTVAGRQARRRSGPGVASVTLPMPACSMSAAVSTARTPGSASAALVVDAADRGKGMRRADEDGMRLAGGAIVVAETPGAGQQTAVLVARLERQAHPGLPPASAAVGAVSLPQRLAGASGKSKRRACARRTGPSRRCVRPSVRHCDRDASHRAPMLV